ncbi:putative thiamine-phosphate synthase [Candidatus Nitrospira nitrosa]|uniref:Thiamine-phosphate synthase n=1 Tax=Candidatus Nitrospira nitrosa TaxID=1742972 RepID=A0A0S4LF96_9BACT|nr:thiamine phosphate synthase [Candidatus Nitrospira nitrosa]CUS35264.1 putative thiamine-phosphate synthase [Candidatus Nitrospira nitrosa]
MPPIDFRLLLVTDRHQTRGRPLPEILHHAVVAGLPAIQVRERDLPTGELLPLLQEIQSITTPRAVPLIVNDRVDLMMALNLDGVHLRSNSLPAQPVRELVGSRRLIGVSTHSAEDVQRANQQGADYVVFGPIFDTPSKRAFGHPLGLALLTEVCRRSSVPVFAIGGITCERVGDVRRAGAHGVAVIGALLTRDDIGEALREFTDALQM